MLYDKRWDKPEIKADPFSLERLIAWLEKQPAKKRYCYNDAGHCLHAQWFEACGETGFCLGRTSVGFSDGRIQRIPVDFRYAAYVSPWTFGAALDRARKALAER